MLTHSGASEMQIGCLEVERDGVPGVSAYVADNGRGFDPSQPDRSGKGLSSIGARARALHGHLDCEAAAGAGARITLWLPYERRQG